MFNLLGGGQGAVKGIPRLLGFVHLGQSVGNRGQSLGTPIGRLNLFDGGQHLLQAFLVPHLNHGLRYCRKGLGAIIGILNALRSSESAP